VSRGGLSRFAVGSLPGNSIASLSALYRHMWVYSG